MRIPNITQFGNLIVGTIYRYLSEMHQMGVSTAWVIGISLLEVRGCKMSSREKEDWKMYGVRNRVERDNVIADRVEIQNFEQVDSLQKMGRNLKNTFDYIWRRVWISVLIKSQRARQLERVGIESLR